MRPVFKSPECQAAFDRDGFVVLPWMTRQEANALSERYDALPSVPQAGFFSGIYSASEAFKRACHALLEGVAVEFARKHLADYRCLVGNFVLKTPDSQSRMPAHQDWTFVDERRFASVNLWCALTDTNEENGAMHLLRGSHRLGHNVRGTGMPSSFEHVGEIPCADMAYVPLEAGQVIVHDHRVLHASPPNRSQRRRLATAICMVPTEATAVHYFQNPATGRLEVYEIDTEFFAKYTYGENRIPEGTRFLRFDDDSQPVQFSREAAAALKEKPTACS